MKRLTQWILAGCFLASGTAVQAQARFLIRFTDKAFSPFTLSAPEAFLSPRAVARRARYGLQPDSTDLPVTPRYLDSLRSLPGITVLNASRWLNQVSVQASDPAALEGLQRFPFVRSVRRVASRTAAPVSAKLATPVPGPVTAQRTTGIQDTFRYGQSFAQVHIHNGEFLHRIGLRGENMAIGMLDAGFFNYSGLRAFDSIRAGGQVWDTWDFVARHQSVEEDHAHGMQCLSTIAANIPDQFVGTAPKASFYLYRTEDAPTEYEIEEHNWVCGAERVDSAGGDLISSSLGYTTFDDPTTSHRYEDLDGNTTIAAIGADLAARKGILVFNSAGNEGTDPWRYIATPADADSIVAVGAVTRNGEPAAFSSYGPSADGQVKPDVASVGQGTVIQLINNAIGTGNGTSFACPNLAGLAACLWQGFPEASNMDIIGVLRASAHQASAPDNRMGYGIPDMKKAVHLLLAPVTTATATVDGCRVTLGWTGKDMEAMRYDVERKLPGDTGFVKTASVPGSGKVWGNRTHAYTEEVPVAGVTVQYRIRQYLDTSAAAGEAYSFFLDTVTVTVQAPCISGASLRVVPNPVRNTVFRLEYLSPEALPDVWIRVVDEAGRTYYQERTSLPAGLFTREYPASHLAKGIYFVSLFQGKRLLGTARMIRL
ncbi:MAG TPA: S8 family peptidase [Chitinophagaceae bacterium]|jgi:hypothetical protein|nr:S8 family peptidase [Chitinophagaceae bacterium]